MQLHFHQVDAFSDRPFAGNPAMVYLLEQWLDDALMQQVAAEHNLAETAFVVAEGEGYRIRWFTPATEVPLCGHATLASAHVLFEVYGEQQVRLDFQSLSGPLSVTREGGRLWLDFRASIRSPWLDRLPWPKRWDARCRRFTRPRSCWWYWHPNKPCVLARRTWWHWRGYLAWV